MPVKGQVGQEGRTKLQLRDRNGKFGVGGIHRAGRPARVVEELYLEVTKGTITAEDWAAIVNVAKEQALGGDRYAREWLAKYLMGPPPEAMHYEDNRSVNLDLSQLSDEQLEQLTQLVGHITDRGGAGEEEIERIHQQGVGGS